MQYYSKTPKELQEDRDAAAEKSQRKFTRGRAILLIDIVLVVLILIFYQSSLKDIFTSHQSEMKNFEWKSYSLQAGCLQKGDCHIEIQGKGLEKVSGVTWRLKNKKDETLFEQMQILERVVTPKKEVLVGRYQIPQEHGDAGLYVEIQTKSSDEKISFRVYP